MFVTFEGGEAAGKSTQIRLLREALEARGRVCTVTREPGGSAAAEAMRGILLDPALPLSDDAEVLLVFAARADHLAATILPALARGEVVLCDRFADSTLAYQGCGGRADAPRRELIATLTARLPAQPDLTFVLDVEPEVAKARLRQRGGAADRYEGRDEAFHARVRAGFRDIAQAHPQRCVLIDANADAAQVHARVLSELDRRLRDAAGAPR